MCSLSKSAALLREHSQTRRPSLPSPSQDTGSFAHSRFVKGTWGVSLFPPVLLFSCLQKRRIFSKNTSFSAAFWLAFRPPPLLSDGGNKAFPPESSVRWRGNGLHSNELLLQASFRNPFLYPFARGINSKQQPNPWASKIHRNSADLTVRGSP